MILYQSTNQMSIIVEFSKSAKESFVLSCLPECMNLIVMVFRAWRKNLLTSNGMEPRAQIVGDHNTH